LKEKAHPPRVSTAELGTLIEFESDSQVGEILGILRYCARELDLREANQSPGIVP
jgi:hypothetical protein